MRESERASVNDRLARVESLLERVLQRLDDVNGSQPSILPSTGAADDSSDAGAAVTPVNENAPILSLFINGVVSNSRIIVSVLILASHVKIEVS